MSVPMPVRPCSWCDGREFLVVENVWLEITDYGRRFDAITCKTCGHTAFFAAEPPSGKTVRAEGDERGPYR